MRCGPCSFLLCFFQTAPSSETSRSAGALAVIWIVYPNCPLSSASCFHRIFIAVFLATRVF